MTPEQLATNGSEQAHQTALFCWAALNTSTWPELRWLHHIPNGGSRGDKRSAMIRGAALRAQGVKSGVSDIFLPVRRSEYSGLYLEMKAPKHKPVRAGSRGGVTDDQMEFGTFVLGQGFGFAVCYGWEEASRIITQYLGHQ